MNGERDESELGMHDSEGEEYHEIGGVEYRIRESFGQGRSASTATSGFYDEISAPHRQRDRTDSRSSSESLEREERNSTRSTSESHTQQLLQRIADLESTCTDLSNANQDLVAKKSTALEEMQKEAQEREVEYQYQRDAMNEEWMLGLALRKGLARENLQLKTRLNMLQRAAEDMAKIARQPLMESGSGEVAGVAQQDLADYTIQDDFKLDDDSSDGDSSDGTSSDDSAASSAYSRSELEPETSEPPAKRRRRSPGKACVSEWR